MLADTIFCLPASGELDAGVIPEPVLRGVGPAAARLFEFISNIDTVNAVLIWHWDVLWDAVRHLILPAVALPPSPWPSSCA